MYSRMLSVVSWTVSVLRRLSANIKAPVSTVSRSRVAECSCSLVGSSLQAAWARGCSKLFTVSTIAWGSSRNTEVTWRKPQLALLSLTNTNATIVQLWKLMQIHLLYEKYCYTITTEDSSHWDATVRMQWLFIYHVDKSWQQKMLAMRKWHSHADVTKAKTLKLLNKKCISKLWNYHQISLPILFFNFNFN